LMIEVSKIVVLDDTTFTLTTDAQLPDGAVVVAFVVDFVVDATVVVGFVVDGVEVEVEVLALVLVDVDVEVGFVVVLVDVDVVATVVGSSVKSPGLTPLLVQ